MENLTNKIHINNHKNVVMESKKSKVSGVNKLFLVLLFSIGYFSAYSQTYYFANSGDDSYTEEQAQDPATPWKTLDKLNSLTLSPRATILFKKGDIWRGQITVNNSGSSGNPITFSTYGTGNKPVISGSILVTGWTQYSGNIYKTTVTENVVQLFCNDERQTLARYPNTGYAKINKVNNNISFESDDVGSTDWTGGVAHMRVKRWTFGSQTITSCNSGNITVAGAYHYVPKVDWGFFINNHILALDSPGEWYYDSNNKTLYYWSPDGDTPDNYTIEASVTNYGFKVNRANNITIDGFIIKHQILSGIEAQEPSCDYITIKNNEIYDTDRIAIKMGESMWNATGMNYITIENNVIDGANSNGIFFSVENSTITKNVVTHIGDDFTKLSAYGIGNLEHASIAIDVHGDNNHVRENRLDQIGYIGIQFTHGRDNIIEYNYVTNYCKTTDDGGGIYTYQMNYDDADVKGSIIRYNIVTDGIGAPEATDQPDYYAVEGIYLDNRSQEVTVIGNTVANCGNNGYFTNNGRDHKFLNNTSYNNHNAQIYLREVKDGIEGYEITGNVFYSLTGNQECVRQFSTIDSKTEFGTYNKNYYCNPYSTSVIHDQSSYYTLATWQAYSGQDADSHKSLITSDDIEYNYGPQMITNGTFDSNIANWSFWSKGGGSNSWEENSLLDGGTLKHDPGSSSSSYASHDISIEEGNLYEVKFSIVSNETKNMKVNVIRNHGDYATLGFGQTITVNATRQDFSFQFEATETEPEAMIYFYNAYGQSTPLFWLDNVSIKEIVDVPSPEEVSPLFMNPTMETANVNLGGKVYHDLDGNVVSGSITLDPFASVILTLSSDNADTIPPSIPTGLSVVSVSETTIELTWDANAESDLKSYNVKRSTQQGGSYEIIATSVTSSYTDTNLTTETTYYYVVSAIDHSSNESDDSQEVSAKTLQVMPPSAPTGLTATVMASNRIDLDWNENTETDFASYKVKRSTTPGGAYTVIAENLTSGNYSDTGLSAETTYYYVVIAVDKSNNESENSDEISATTTDAEPLTDPYSFYDFEEGSGTSAADLGTLKNNGTLTGSDINWATGGVTASGAEGDGCVQITGSTTSGRSYVKVPYNELHNSYDYTFSAWVKWDTNVSPDWAYVFWQNGDDSQKTRHVDMWWDKQYKTVSTSMNDENGGSIGFRPTGTTVDIFDGNWHLVAITMENGTDVRLWVDGQKTGEVTSTTKVAINGGDDLWLGTMPRNDPDGVTKMVGFIDRVGIYDQALTPGQIAELYATKSSFDDPSTGVKEFDNASMFKLYQNTPNPFSSETTIAYELKQSGFVTLQVFDITGKVVATLEQSEKPVGFYRVKWNRLSTTNHVVSHGIYLYKLVLISKNNVFYDVKKIVVK